MLGMADWAHSRLAHLPRAQLDRMWSIYIAGEYNAMPVVLADLYALTGDEKLPRDRRSASSTPRSSRRPSTNQDILDGEHANQHIPQFVGYLEIFDYARKTDCYSRATSSPPP